jgi:hypothetical protein
MVVHGTLVDKAINVDVKKSPKSGGGVYKGFRIAFRNEAGEIKEIAKHMNVLKYNPTIAQNLDALTVGDEMTLTMEKEGEYWELKSIVKGKADLPDEAPGSASVPSTPAKAAQATGGKVIGSTYETPAERKVKQRLIVRQSSFAQALEFHKEVGVVALEALFNDAEKIETWVYRDIE